MGTGVGGEVVTDITAIIPWVVNTSMWAGYTLMILATWLAVLLLCVVLAEFTIKKGRFISEFLRFVAHRAHKRTEVKP